ncbi:MAG: hypothetical protein ACRCY3_09725 [Sphingorhabdus sp.]
MCTRIYNLFLLAALTALAGCDSGKKTLADAEREAAGDAAEAGKVDCALAGSSKFERVCTTETLSASSGNMLVIRHPDGGFRRFDILTDGRGLTPADGFDETAIKILNDGMIELRSGDDSYRLPAAIKGSKTG